MGIEEEEDEDEEGEGTTISSKRGGIEDLAILIKRDGISGQVRKSIRPAKDKK